MASFIFGGDGMPKTPQELARIREIAARLQQGGTPRNVGEGIDALGKGLVSGVMRARANKAEGAGRAGANNAFSSIMAALGGNGAMGATSSPEMASSAYAAPVADPETATADPVQGRIDSAFSMFGGQPAPKSTDVGGSDLKSGIEETAAALGIDPVDLATVISYETAGTFDPAKSGPTTQWGQHRGLIQFGEPQAEKYGVDWNDPAGSQLGGNGAIAQYLSDAGVRPGMGIMDVYSAINAGKVGRYNASDAANGGAPGTVADKVNNQMAPHRAKAMAMFGNGASSSPGQQAIAQATQPKMPPQMGPPPQMPQRPTQAPQPPAAGGQQWFQAGHPSAPLQQASQIDPGMLARLQGQPQPQGQPQAQPGGGFFSGIAGALSGMGRQQRPTQPAPRQMAPQGAPMPQMPQTGAQTASQPQQQPQQGGFDLAQAVQVLNNPYLNDGQREALKMIVAQELQKSDPMRRLQLEKGQLEIEKLRNPTTADIQEYEYAKNQGFQGSFSDFVMSMKKAGATNVSVGGGPELGKLSTDYGYVLDPATGRPKIDPQTGLPQAAPVPGSKAAQDILDMQKAKETADQTRSRSGNIVLEDIDRALAGLDEGNLPTSGPVGGALSNVPGTQAFDVSALLDTIRANSGFDRLQSMRDSSPTGGALGQVSEREMTLLQAALGNLSQSQNAEQLKYNLSRVRRVYDEIINGPGRATKGPEQTVIDGYTIEQAD